MGESSKRLTPLPPYPLTPLLVFSFYLLQGPADGVHAGIIVDVVDIDVPDGPLLVDNKNSSFSDTLRPENVIFKRSVAMGPEIAEDGEGDVDPLGPGLEAGKIVRKHTQDLGVELREEVL